MKLATARQAWHDSTYTPTRGGLSGLAERQLLGVAVQTTDKGVTADHAVHAALCGWVQSAIAKLHPQVRVFGEFMYSALHDDAIQEAAEEVVFAAVTAKAKRMTQAKREKAEYVVKGVLLRYRRMHQGGQSANVDPLIKPEAFRAWLFDQYGIRLESCNWDRDWGDYIKLVFETCEDIDRMALSPIAGLIYRMREEAA